MATVRHQVHANSTITANGQSTTVPNTVNTDFPSVLVVVDTASAPTGTGPTLTYSLLGSVDGVRWYTIATFAAITAALSNPQRNLVQNVLDPLLAVSWAVGGTTPSFTNVKADLLMPGLIR